MNNLMPLQNKMNPAPPHMRPRLRIGPPQLQAPHRSAPFTGAMPATNMKNQFLKRIP